MKKPEILQTRKCRNYASPSVKVIEVTAQGIVCSSDTETEPEETVF